MADKLSRSFIFIVTKLSFNFLNRISRLNQIFLLIWKLALFTVSHDGILTSDPKTRESKMFLLSSEWSVNYVFSIFVILLLFNMCDSEDFRKPCYFLIEPS